MDEQQLLMTGLGLVALGCLLAGGLLVLHLRQRTLSQQAIQRAIARGQGLQPPRADEAPADLPASASRRGSGAAQRWLDSRLGRRLVVDEDRRLIDQCGFAPLRAQLWFLALRLGLGLGLPLLYAVLLGYRTVDGRAWAYAAAACALGFMAPKWFLAWYAEQRKRRVVHELPLFVDLLRLLQGVGLSLDQTLQVIASDFRGALRVLGQELDIANRQYTQGRTREHSLQRLAHLHDNENLADMVALLVQVDRHGGAVQEPLHQFSDRLRERRKAELRERVGKITVKMTAIMVTTLLPALIIVTAGPGFLAIVRSLGAMIR
jgi:tight adherence protein C